jgi:hypothetical protein
MKIRYFDRENPANSRFRLIQKALIIFLVFIVSYSFFDSGKTFASIVATDNGGYETIVIKTIPEKSFIIASNMAPGDLAKSQLTVKNEGQLDFSYDISAIKDNGDDLLYNVLNLQITDSIGNILYNGKLKDLQNMVLGNLGPGHDDVFGFQVNFPLECGNEYQDKGVAVTFVLNASEHPPDIDGGVID